jgi:hypothetical protein
MIDINCFLWSSLQQECEKKYSIIGQFDLTHVTSDAQTFFDVLKSLQKSYYAPNEKIIISHFDTDFYLTNDIGLHLYNLLELLRQLDISLSSVIFFTNHEGIQQEIKNHIEKKYHNHDFDNDYLKIVECNYQLMMCPETISDHVINSGPELDKIEKKFIYLNGQKRSHRLFFLSLLKDLNCLDSGICSWHFNRQSRSHFDNLPQVESTTLNVSQSMIWPHPYTRINDFFTADSDLKQIFNKHSNSFNNNYKDERLHEGPNGLPYDVRFWIPAVKQALLYVVAETVFDYPYPYISEKTWTPILNRRPFVVLGACNTLARLKNLGFKTFAKFWDESYDSEPDCSKRMKKVAAICQQICSMSVADFDKLCNNIVDTVEYNFQHYLENYSKSQLTDLLAKI